MDPAIEGLADELVQITLQHDPLHAALLGMDPVGAPLADLRIEADESTRRRYESVFSRAETLATDGGPFTEELDILTLDLVRSTAANLVQRFDVPTIEFTITDFASEPFPSLLSAVPQVPIGTPERRQEHLRRLEALPAFLEQAADRHRRGLERGLRPVARSVRAAIAQLDAVLGDPDAGGLRRPVEDLQDEQDQILSALVRPALERYRAVLDEEMLPIGRSDDEPGLCFLPGGDEFYRLARRYSTSTDRSAEDLHQMGLDLFVDLEEEFKEVGNRLWGTTDLAEIFRHLREDDALRYESSEEIVAMAIDAVRRAEASAPDWFGVVPSTPCAVEPVPAALAEGSAPAYYYPGALDGSRPGTYFVNTTTPEQRFRQLAECVAFHEAVPGHHFELTIAQEHGGHLAHQMFGDVTTAEGWGLYSERLADEMGLYSSDVARLGLFSADAWRAARLVVDTGLHAMGWGRQTAIEWMSAHVPISEIEIISEVDRYIVMPGQALAYMVGRAELRRLRAESERRLGGSFDVRAFHDQVLAAGPVPPPALSAAIERWLARS